MNKDVYSEVVIDERMVDELGHDIVSLLEARGDKKWIKFVQDHFTYAKKSFIDFGGSWDIVDYGNQSNEKKYKMFVEIEQIFDISNLLMFVFRKDGEFILRTLQRKYVYKE